MPAGKGSCSQDHGQARKVGFGSERLALVGTQENVMAPELSRLGGNSSSARYYLWDSAFLHIGPLILQSRGDCSIYHMGLLWRLNEIAYGDLCQPMLIFVHSAWHLECAQCKACHAHHSNLTG